MSGSQNTKVSAAYIQWLLATNRGIMGHLYQFTQAAPQASPSVVVWFRLNNGLWNGSALANPTTGIGGFTFSSGEGPAYAYAGEGTGFVGNQVMTVNFGASAFDETIPEGFVAPGVGAVVTWNPSDKGTDVILSEGNLGMTVGSESQGAVRSTITLPTVNAYYEAKFITAVPQDAIFGVATGSAPLKPDFGGLTIPFSAGIRTESGTVAVNDTFYLDLLGPVAVGDIMCVAVAYQPAPITVGNSDFFTDLDTDITFNGALWKSGSLRFEGLQRKLGIGLSVDEQTLKIWAAPTDTMFGANFLTGAEEGLLDGATIVRYRAIWPFVTGNAAHDVQLTPIAVWPLFTGLMSTIGKGGMSHVEYKVKSALLKLNVNMPRNYFQPGCLWTLYSPGCTLVKSNFAQTASVDTGPNLTTIPVLGGVATPVGADGIDNYAQGRLMFTSGVNEGLQVLIDHCDSANLYLAYPLNALPSFGDTITYYPSCSKSHNTCEFKFGNQNNYRGFDEVPPVMLSV